MEGRRFIYLQAEYLAMKYFHVHINELPDGKRLEVLRVAKRQGQGF
jgi:hypothetical protein